VPWARKRGWNVVGVDRSAAMLREARRKPENVRWVQQDITRLDIRERADFVTCHFDALNHLLDARDLQRVFTRVAGVLRPGGLFQFDLNTVHWLRWLKGREKLFRVGAHSFMASNEFDERTGVATFRQLWFVRTGRLYERRLITVRERAFRDADIRTMLRRAGLRLLNVSTQRRIDGKPVRKLYLAAGMDRGPAPGHV
jgi:SAM-dependent methyltransferase